jgi:hypothetical protein
MNMGFSMSMGPRQEMSQAQRQTIVQGYILSMRLEFAGCEEIQ